MTMSTRPRRHARSTIGRRIPVVTVLDLISGPDSFVPRSLLSAWNSRDRFLPNVNIRNRSLSLVRSVGLCLSATLLGLDSPGSVSNVLTVVIVNVTSPLVEFN